MDWFGWLVFDAGDVGSPGGGPLDGIDDIVVHAEDTDFVGNSTNPTIPQVEDVGALFVYYGLGGGTLMVDPEHVLLQRPSNIGLPELEARMGRVFARIEAWRDSTSGDLEPGLLIAEPDATWDGKDKAGIVYLIRLPLPAQPADPWAVAPILNVWRNTQGQPTPLTEPLSSILEEQTDDHLFGSMIVVLDYKGDQGNFPGQQFVVSARQADIQSSSGLVNWAGRAYPYLPPPVQGP